jgi:hypothetical protein
MPQNAGKTPFHGGAADRNRSGTFLSFGVGLLYLHTRTIFYESMRYCLNPGMQKALPTRASGWRRRAVHTRQRVETADRVMLFFVP